MRTEVEIKLTGMEALVAKLGLVEAEKFISLMLREPFDYTTWQKDLWSGQSVRDISKMASNQVKSKIKKSGR